MPFDTLPIVRKVSSVPFDLGQDKVWKTLHHREQHHWLGEVGRTWKKANMERSFVGVSNPIIFQLPLHDFNGISRKKFKTESDIIFFSLSALSFDSCFNSLVWDHIFSLSIGTVFQLDPNEKALLGNCLAGICLVTDCDVCFTNFWNE